MGMNAATLNGLRATSARANLPAWGCWYADVALDGEHSLSGRVELKIADLTLVGSVLSGGPAKGRSFFRVVAGAGGWGRELPAKSYNSDAGVKVSTVVGDAAREVGETVAAISADLRTGPAFVRPAASADCSGRASLVLDRVAPRGWHVGEDGITRLGLRASSPYVGTATKGPLDRARGTLTLAAESIATILPGVVVDGLEAADVRHEISAKDGLRSTIWGKLSDARSRRLDALRKIMEQLDPDRRFRGVTEYRVAIQAGNRVSLQPVRVSTGMPVLERVKMRPGVSGATSTVALGSLVLVGFADSDPGRPYVAAFEDAEGEGFVPILTHIDATLLRLGDGARPAIGAGDLAGGFWPCAPTQVRTLI
jgi:hypothetical protein